MDYSDLLDAFDSLGLDVSEAYDEGDEPAGFEVRDNGEVIAVFDTDDFSGLEDFLQELLSKNDSND